VHAALVLPSANRVYAGAAPALLAAELEALSLLALGGRIGDVQVTTLGGAPYVTFGGDLDGDALAAVSNLSALYALFAVEGDLLRPADLRRLDRWDDDLVTIQRYTGKTNEQLTRLLLNLAVAAGPGAAAFTGGTRPRVLDPLSGRGTTLNVALLCGFDAAGIDHDRKDVDAHLQFLTTWLKAKKAKHSSKRSGARTTLVLAPDKEAMKAGASQELVVAAGDTTSVVDHLGKSSVDAVVTDLPYGVQHGSQAGDGLRRSPAELLAKGLPAWRAALRPGGGLALSWNTKVLPRTELVALLEGARFEVLEGGPFDRFAHRVDQAIDRDVVVARRPAA
jgi:SAM-dependent methyltransferase